MNSNILNNLNDEQVKAVKHHKGPLLILAGAGSGKTRVLTHRIAYLMEEHGVNPWHILALTFTNKAAKEMRERVNRIVGSGAENIWVSTFHSTCVRILRRYIDLIGYDSRFTIYDTDDQKNLMRDVLKHLNLDNKLYPERRMLSYISSAKDELITPDAYEQRAGNPNEKTAAKVYREYQRRLKANNALDFDDLITKTVELFQTQPEVLSYYRNRFRYLMVDEYQDTNSAQFKLIHLMAAHTNDEGEVEKNICVVGDDDQSIYKFRGANIYNILNFEKLYPDAKVIKLEQNYRSTQNILQAANEVIRNNSARKDKSLWSEQEEGEPILYTKYGNDMEEADGIVRSIKEHVATNGATYNEFAILYRTNAQSRSFEERLIATNIPYKIVGALNFYARKEIKDCLSYLKTIDNGLDDMAVKRILNVPRRGIGSTTIERITEYAMTMGMSFYEALQQVDDVPEIKRVPIEKIKGFVGIVEGWKSRLDKSPTDDVFVEYQDDDDDCSVEEPGPIEQLMRDILEDTGYMTQLLAEGTDESKDRIENINEFVNRIHIYEHSDNEDAPTLSGLLEEIALVADIDNVEEDAAQVLLMTLHSAKGLEFPYVYICGMEDNIFPSMMAITSPDVTDLEEERRLCYVGITRAMKKLFISSAKQRMRNGTIQFNPPSRFISEIPRFLIKQSIGEGEQRGSMSRTPSRTIQPRSSFGGAGTGGARPSGVGMGTGEGGVRSTNNLFANNPYIQKGIGARNPPGGSTAGGVPDYAVGDSVKHMRFGNGVVMELVPIRDDYEVTVAFDGFGNRKMRTSVTKLQKK